MDKKQKFYVVWEGRAPGVYETWDECEHNVRGFKGAKFKSFSTRAAADAAFCRAPPPCPPEAKEGALAVDGACAKSVGEFRGVLLPAGIEVFREGPFKHATNNSMEFLAVVRGLRWMARRGLRMPLYSDSETAISWVKHRGKCACYQRPPKSSPVELEIRIAEEWIAGEGNGVLKELIEKWDTATYGEIPADFGRK